MRRFVKSLEAAVAALPPADLAEFRRWFAAFEARSWDRRIEADAAAGAVDALLTEAEADYRSLPRRSL